MRPLLSPASLKGVLTAAEAAAALAEGFGGGDELPVADGGEGTAEVVFRALGGEWRSAQVADPLGRRVEGRWLVVPDVCAVVEAASAIGLPLLAVDERDPLRASSRGLGQLIVEAIESAPKWLLVGLGGTATVDGGAGLLQVVKALPDTTTALYDVGTRLPDAARLFGPQKGASPDDVRTLERNLRSMTELRPFAELPGSGAAGGLGAALASLGADLVPGAATVLDLIGFDEALVGCDLVVTGEGAVDATTLEGKAPFEVARRAREAGVRCVVFGGRVEVEIEGAETVALSGDPARARADLVELGRALAAGGGSGTPGPYHDLRARPQGDRPPAS